MKVTLIEHRHGRSEVDLALVAGGKKVLLARVRYRKAEYFFPALCRLVRMEYWDDGFYFRHPVDGPLYVNHNATPFSPPKGGDIEKEAVEVAALLGVTPEEVIEACEQIPFSTKLYQKKEPSTAVGWYGYYELKEVKHEG